MCLRDRQHVESGKWSVNCYGVQRVHVNTTAENAFVCVYIDSHVLKLLVRPVKGAGQWTGKYTGCCYFAAAFLYNFRKKGAFGAHCQIEINAFTGAENANHYQAISLCD